MIVRNVQVHMCMHNYMYVSCHHLDFSCAETVEMYIHVHVLSLHLSHM